jgi:type VI secretion system protein ImpG
MDDLTLRYYDAEMRYLLEAGEEFARAHPEQAAMLNLGKALEQTLHVRVARTGFIKIEHCCLLRVSAGKLF